MLNLTGEDYATPVDLLASKFELDGWYS